jgi:hypothetical protein
MLLLGWLEEDALRNRRIEFPLYLVYVACSFMIPLGFNILALRPKPLCWGFIYWPCGLNPCAWTIVESKSFQFKHGTSFHRGISEGIFVRIPLSAGDSDQQMKFVSTCNTSPKVPDGCK